MIGQSISHYNILEKLGAGAMGEVYLAYDTTLGRKVALKVLPSELAENQDGLRRFQREAKTLAALDHPNIVAIHSVEEAEGVHFLTMQFVRGRLLSELIPKGGMSLDQFFEISIALADALASAHEKGVVHRDLKPTNIMVTEDDSLKVLDFGLAKLRQETAFGGTTESQTEPLTVEGHILGTIPYMSPEQVEGLPTDSRSDIFSLGVILHELATGSRPFAADTTASLVCSILKDEPKLVSDLRPGLPRQLGRIVKSCLAKKPGRRFQSARDVRNQIIELREELATHDSSPPVTPAIKSRPASLVWALRSVGIAIVLLLGMSLAMWLSQRWTTGPRGEGTPELFHPDNMALWPFTTQGTFSGFPSWSPDGRFLVFAAYQEGTMDIFKKSIEGGDPVQLTFSPSNAMQPDWSPDGKTIAFASDLYEGGIYLIGSQGGTPWQISEFGRKPHWSPNGEILSFEWNGGIYVTSADKNKTKQIVESTSGSPHAIWSQNGARLIYWDRAGGDISVIPVEGGESKLLNLIPAGMEVSGISLTSDGKTLYFSGGPFGGEKDIWRVDLDPSSSEPRSDPVRLTLSPTDDVDCAVAPDGRTLAFTARTTERNLWTLPLGKDGLISGDARQLTSVGHQNYYPALSPDGSIMTWTSHQAGQGLLYYHHFDLGEEKKLTSEWGRSAREIGVTFSPDGDQIAYSSTVGGSYQLWRRPCLGCVELRLTQTSNPSRDVHPTWSPQDNTLAFYSNRAGSWDIWLLDLGHDGEPTQLISLPSSQLYPAWSPDGQLIAFRSDQGESADIWVIDRNGENLQPLITTPGEEAWPAWSPGGDRLYFSSSVNGSFNIWLRDLDREGDPRQVTSYEDPSFGLPETGLLTKFVVDAERMIVPLEDRKAEIYLLELGKND